MNEYYTFTLNDDVVREHVSFASRFGIKIAADLYVPKALDRDAKHPALVIGPPYGGCKEQGAGVYANELATLSVMVLF